MKKNLVFLHGWERSKHDWDILVKMFDDEYVCTTLDFPGFGENKIFDKTWGVPEYKNWLKNEIKDLDNVVLVGHSFGGRVASFLASENLPNITGLILFAAPSIYRPDYKVIIKSKLAFLVKEYLPNMVINKLSSLKPIDLQNAEKNGKAEVFKRVVPFDQTEFLQKINIPTLIVWGREDMETSYKIGEEINKLVKNSELKIIEDGTHNLHIEKPTLFCGIIKNFVNKIYENN